MKSLIALISLVLCATLVYSSPLGGYYSTFTGDFGGPSAFDGASFASMQAARGDNRQNRGDQGPVVFPVVENPIVESSGVVVGASGFGFVPPGASSKFQ